MSQAKKICKEIAGTEEYRKLAGAFESGDHQAISDSYAVLRQIIQAKRKEVEDSIEASCARFRNPDGEKRRFWEAFCSVSTTFLPAWHRLDTELQKAGVMEGEVWGLGAKGHPMVRTPEGKVVILDGCQLETGQKVRFQVVHEKEKVGFGRLYELTADSLYSLFTQESRAKVIDSLRAADALLREYNDLAATGGYLSLPDSFVDELAAKFEGEKLVGEFKPEERDSFLARFRRLKKEVARLAGVRGLLDLLAKEEEKECREVHSQNPEQAERALSSPRLLNHASFAQAKARLNGGDGMPSCEEVVANWKSKQPGEITSMASALKLIELEEEIQNSYVRSKQYLDRMDKVFQCLIKAGERWGISTMETVGFDLDKFRERLGPGLADLANETLPGVFRSFFPSRDDFYAGRNAFLELKERLEGGEIAAAEAAFKPCLASRISRVLSFGKR
ncbi:MAG: hypothetical protein V1737_02395 [Chloroflexota bacterium]